MRCVLSRFSHVCLFATLGSLPGSIVHGSLQAGILEWVAIFFSRGSSQHRTLTHVSYVSCIGRQILYHQHHRGSPISGIIVIVQSLSRVLLFATLWTVAHQAPLSMGFSRQEYWSGLPFPYLGDLPDLGIKLASPPWQTDSLSLSHLGSNMLKPVISNTVNVSNLKLKLRFLRILLLPHQDICSINK